MTTEKLKTDITCYNGRLAWQTKSALTHQAPAKGGQVQDNGTRETECGTNSCNELIPLFPYFLIPL